MMQIPCFFSVLSVSSVVISPPTALLRSFASSLLRHSRPLHCVLPILLASSLPGFAAITFDGNTENGTTVRVGFDGDAGSVTIDGGSTLNSTTALVGDGTLGVVTLNGGNWTNTGNFTLGLGAGGSGNLTIANGTLSTGNFSSAAGFGSSANITINSGGNLTVTNQIANILGNSSVDINGGFWSALVINSRSQSNQWTIRNGGSVSTQQFRLLNSIVNIESLGLVSVGVDSSVQSGSVNVTNGILNAYRFYLGLDYGGNATLGSNLIVNSGGVAQITDLYIKNNAEAGVSSAATVNNGGNLTANQIIVGNGNLTANSNGTLTINSGGFVQSNGTL